MSKTVTEDLMINDFYVDFYKENDDFLTIYDKTLDNVFLNDDERDTKAIYRLLNDIVTIDLSKVENLTKLM